MRRIATAAVFAGLMLGAAVAHADPRADFEKARAAFLARNWTDAEDKLRALLDPKSGLKERTLISQSRMYLGATLLQQAKKDEAKDTFEKLVIEDPQFEPDPLSFPGPAIDLFFDTRSSLLEQIKNAQQTAARLAAEKKAKDDAEHEAQRVWLEKVKAQASEESITLRHTRLIAMVPFGIGQFQNNQPELGWTFLGAQVAALAGTATTFFMFRYAVGRRNDTFGGTNQLSQQWNDRAEDIRIANLSFVGGFAAVAAIGIVQAQIAFTPEDAETKKRPLPAIDPPRPQSLLQRIVPIVSPSGNGIYLGGAARF